MYRTAAPPAVTPLRVLLVSENRMIKEDFRLASTRWTTGRSAIPLLPAIPMGHGETENWTLPELSLESVEGVAQAQRHLESLVHHNRFAYVVIDGRVLHGKDCRQVAQRLWQAQPSLGIIIHGGLGRQELEEFVLEGGATHQVLAFESPLQPFEIVSLLRGLTLKQSSHSSIVLGDASGGNSDDHLRRLESITARLQQEQERRQWLEEKLCRAQRLETVGRLTDGIAHYFNNYITVIQGHLSVALASSEGCAVIQSSLKQLLTAAKHVADMTSQLVAYNHREYLKPQPVRLDHVIDNEISILSMTLGEGIALNIHHEADMPQVLADPACLGQIVLSLALHARDAMPLGGKIAIETKSVQIRDEATAKAIHSEARTGDFVMMTLTDTGEAMKSDDIYKLLTTSTLATKWGRDGEIGLMLAQGLVRHQGGWLAVSSTPEVGNEFSIYLPVSSNAEDNVDDNPTKEAKSVGDPEASTILIVEDEDSVREVMEYVLTSQGHNVLVAKDANEAWAQWRRRSMVIKLAIIDIKLPGGVSGFDLERALADEDPSLPVIFTCGYSQASLASVRELKAGENFLPKPFGMVELLKVVGQALQRPTRFK